MAKLLTVRSDGRYRCKYKDKYFYGRTQTEALRARDNYRDMLKAGLNPETSGTTVREYSASWLPTHKAGIKKQTYNTYASYIDRINDLIGDKPVSQVVPSDIKSVYNDFLGMSDSTVKKVKMLIVSMFRSAVEDGYIRKNPCTNVTPHQGKSGSHRAITDEERQLIINTPAKFRLAVLVMLYAGLRRGEVLALDMSSVDFKEKVIRVTEAVSFDGNARVVGDPKTQSGIREVPLFSRLEAELKGHTGLVAGKEFTQTGFERAWEGYVNTIERSVNGCQKRWYGRRKEDKQRDPVKYAKVVKLEKEAEKLRRFGKKAEAKQKQSEADALRLAGWKSFTVRPHDLRHSFVQMLCDANVEIDLAMKWCGHGDERMIRHIYDHVSEYRSEKAITDVETVITERKM